MDTLYPQSPALSLKVEVKKTWKKPVKNTGRLDSGKTRKMTPCPSNLTLQDGPCLNEASYSMLQ